MQNKAKKRNIFSEAIQKSSFRNWKIRNKIIFGFFIVVIFFGLISYASISFVIMQFQDINRTTLVIHEIITRQKELDATLKDYYFIDNKNDLTPINFSLERANFNKQMDDYENITGKYAMGLDVIKIKKSNEEFLKTGEEIVRLQNERLDFKDKFRDLYEKEKNTRYAMRSVIYEKNNPALVKSFDAMSYESKEALFQYKDKTHVDDWLNAMKIVKAGIKNDIVLISLANDYDNTGRQIAELLPQMQKNEAAELLNMKELKSEEKSIYDMQKEADKISARQANDISRASIIVVFMFMLFAFLLAIRLSYFLAYFISDPIKKMANYAMDISKGSFQKRLDIDSVDEIGQTASTLNVMLDKLQEARAILEVKVSARTKKLKDLYEGLDSQVKEQTKEYEEKVRELERFKELAVGRELRMIELKKEMENLKSGKINK